MMKKIHYYLGGIFIVIGLMAFASGGNKNTHSVRNSSGPPPGYAGDPKSGNRNCSSCHSGQQVQSQSGWISSNIPHGSYVPDSTYTITATAKAEDITKFGFQISPQDTEGNFLGTLINTGSNTKLTSDASYVSHTSTGTEGNDSLSWTFDWTAPPEGSGEVIFYGAFNIANGNGSTSGDEIVVSTLSVKESATGIPDHSAKGNAISLYPNPAKDYITLEVDYSMLGSSYRLIDQAGRQVLTGEIKTVQTTVSIDQLGKGIYYMQIGSQSRKAYKLIKE